jgi:tetratricopeptide (TPR) repeat protein
LLLLTADPDQATALLKSGLLHLRQGELTEARRDLESSSKLDPKNPFTWTSLAETYLRLKQPHLANTAAQTAEKAGAHDPIVAHALAMFYTTTQQYARAAAFEKQFAEGPQADSGALGRAAGLYLNAGDPKEALPLAEKASIEHPSPDEEDVLGRALIASGDVPGGSQHLADAWNGAKNNPQIAFDYAQVLLHAQDFTRASDVLDDSLKLNANNAQLTLALGVARYGQRRFSDAIAAFLHTIELNPLLEQPYLFLGRLLDQAGDQLPVITADYRKWLAIAPRRPEPPLLLAKALLAANADSSDAEPLLRRSLQLDPQNWESHFELGLLLSKKHDYAHAAAELERSIALDPKQAMPHYHLARVYDRLGQKDRAEAERKIHQTLTAPAH